MEVLKFDAVNSISEAELLVGAWVEIESEHAVSLPEGTFWDHELTGCRLRNTVGETLGEVTGVLRIAGNSQLVVQGKSGEFLVPVVAAICREISIARREIVVVLPDGLIDINN